MKIKKQGLLLNTFILANVTLATMQDSANKPYGLESQPCAIVVIDGYIKWAGAQNSIPDDFISCPMHNMAGRLVTPALIDCHTHLVFGGNRANEFEQRLNGAHYEEIAKAGGGIMSTVTQTRAASEDELIAQTLPRLDALLAEGVQTIEIKSGYGLDIENELKMLRVARKLSQMRPVRILTTLLAAHALPPEYKGKPNAYIEEICIPAMREAHAERLVDAVDGFCENIAFTPEQISRVFDAAKELGLPVKLHAEQLSNQGGAALAASYGAFSADHLEYLDEAGIAAMKQAGTVAVMLPGAFYTLRETKLPPIEGLRNAGVPMALATDCNPGTSPLTSLLLAMNMGCTLFRMTPEETLAGVTRNAAKALGLQNEIGTIETGKRAELSVWDIEHPSELSYRIGFNPLYKSIRGEFA